MRPDRIILGECRGEEAFDMLQAMNTGHEGSMATIHANAPREAISRLEQMIGMAGMPMTIASIRGQIASAVRVIVQLQRLSDGKRKVTSIAEITGLEGDILQMQEIYKYTRTGTASDGTVEGQFYATGVRPRFLTDLVARGIHIPGAYFDPRNRCDPNVDGIRSTASFLHSCRSFRDHIGRSCLSILLQSGFLSQPVESPFALDEESFKPRTDSHTAPP